MSKVFFVNNVDNNVLLKGLINDGVLLKFTVAGKYLGEYPVTFTGSFKEIDIVSVLYCVGEIEIACNIDGVFTKHRTTKSLADLVIALNNLSDLLVVGKREGVCENQGYSQYIYGFTPRTYTLQNILEVLI